MYFQNIVQFKLQVDFMLIILINKGGGHLKKYIILIMIKYQVHK